MSGEASLATESSPKRLTALCEREWRDVRGGEIAMVFQEPMTSLNPVMRIGADRRSHSRASAEARNCKCEAQVYRCPAARGCP